MKLLYPQRIKNHVLISKVNLSNEIGKSGNLFISINQSNVNLPKIHEKGKDTHIMPLYKI